MTPKQLKEFEVDMAPYLRLAKMIRKSMDEVLPQAGKLVLDIGLINDMLMLSAKIIKDLEARGVKE